MVDSVSRQNQVQHSESNVNSGRQQIYSKESTGQFGVSEQKHVIIDEKSQKRSQDPLFFTSFGDSKIKSQVNAE
jgi:hypothetical protein